MPLGDASLRVKPLRWPSRCDADSTGSRKCHPAALRRDFPPVGSPNNNVGVREHQRGKVGPASALPDQVDQKLCR